MEMFHRILKTAVDGGASDVHLKIGTPVIFRISRQLVAIECPHPTRGMDEQNRGTHYARLICKSESRRSGKQIFPITCPALAVFERTCFSSEASGVSRCATSKRRCRVSRNWDCLPQIKKIAESPRGIVLLAGLNRFRQIDDAGGDDRAHQCQFQKAHHHAGRSRSSSFSKTTNRSSNNAKSGWIRCPFIMRSSTCCARIPDIIMIGEMRDSISFTAAMSAADTGHLVLSTLHTTNAAQSVSAHSGFLQSGRTRADSPAARRAHCRPWFASAW